MTQEQTNYRDAITAIAERHSGSANDDFVRGLLTGAPGIIDRQAAEKIAEWLETEANGEWVLVEFQSTSPRSSSMLQT